MNAHAFGQGVLRQYGTEIRGGLLVGLTLALVTIPQAVAFSVTLAGVPPSFGISAAIWGVLFCAVLNPSRVFHGGPNNSMSAAMGVTLLPLAVPFSGEYMGLALALGLMAGLVQLAFYAIRPLGRMLDLISEPVINGFISGIGLFLIFKALTTFGGLPINTEVEWPLWIAWQSLLAVAEIGNIYAIQVGLITLVTAVVAQQFQRLRQWAILMGIVAGTLHSQLLELAFGRQTTLVEQIGNLSMGHVLSPSLPLFRQEAMPDIVALMPSAVTLAMLGLFQTVTALRRMNRKSGHFTDSRSAIFSDAIANCLLPFLSSLPTCASFNRMWLVHKLNIHSRIAIAISALWVLVLVQFFSKIIAVIPMPAMAAVIMVLGANMLKMEDVKPHFKHKGEALVFLASFLSVLFLDLFDAVVLGSIVAVAYAKWQQAHPTVSLKNNVLKVRGNLYFGSLPIIEAKYHEAVQSGVAGLVIDISECHYIDPEGIRWLSTAKAQDGAVLMDRRAGRDRREGPKDGSEGGEEERRNRRPDRRRRAEF